MCRIDGSDERASVYCVTTPVARVEHLCGECRRTILVGEPHERHDSVYDGSASTHRVCSHCAVLADWLMRECGGTVVHELIEDIQEHADEYQRGDLGQLAALARNQWMKGPSFRKPYPGIPIPTMPPPLALAQS